ncbi:MAG TPA: permease [Bacteroidota bacterium]|nr:permease [Bacteroidota bacterium]
MEFATEVLTVTMQKVWETFLHNWPFLLLSVLVTTLLKVYVDSKKISSFLQKHRRGGIITATAAAVGTPLCSCGTTAVVLGMMASTMPWAPIIAFMVASPLTSPEELIYSAGLFGWPFALTFFGASIVLGLGAGAVTTVLERQGMLKGQMRIIASCCAGVTTETTAVDRSKMLLPVFWETGRKLLVMFFGFAFVGYLVNGLIPAHWVAAVFGNGNSYSVPLAATLGLPFYVSTEASLPIVRTLMDAGMSSGSALAFLITGAGTSLGAIAGALTIARWRIIGLVVAILWVGAIAFGYAYDLLRMF